MHSHCRPLSRDPLDCYHGLPASAEIERRSSLELLAEAARTRGLEVVEDGSALLFGGSGQVLRLGWPPGPSIAKSEIPGLLEGLTRLRPVPTRPLRRASPRPPWLPCCIKPDRGTLGEGFRKIHQTADWRPASVALPDDGSFVVQPLLAGVEVRVTVCGDGHYAVARLEERRQGLSRWADETADFSADWIDDFFSIVRRRGAPGLGFDAILVDGLPHVLDVNAGPCLALHLVTEPPRDLAPFFLTSWLEVERPDTARRTSGRRRFGDVRHGNRPPGWRRESP